jgi:hypothetical protein
VNALSSCSALIKGVLGVFHHARKINPLKAFENESKELYHGQMDSMIYA